MKKHNLISAVAVVISCSASTAFAGELGLGVSKGTASVSIGSARDGTDGSSNNTSVSASLGGNSGSVSVGTGGGNISVGGGSNGTGTTSGTGGVLNAGANQSQVPQIVPLPTMQIVGTTVWSLDGELVGVVTAHQLTNNQGMLVVEVQTADELGLGRDRIRFQIAPTAFDDGKLVLSLNRANVIAAFT